jgi:hypothetical protein
MSTLSLHGLEERLVREAPGFNWICEAVSHSGPLNGTNIPQEIQVRATRKGVPVKGSPFYLSGECLVRWGFDTSAALICNELTPKSHPHGDRLAEV